MSESLIHSHGCSRCRRIWSCSAWLCVVGNQKRGEPGKMIHETNCGRCVHLSDEALAVLIGSDDDYWPLPHPRPPALRRVSRANQGDDYDAEVD